MIFVKLPSANIYVDLDLEPCTNIRAVYENGNINLTWTDPGDIVLKGETITKQRGTKIICNKDHYPENVKDGELLATETTINTYKDTPFVIEGVEPEEEFYILLVPYNQRLKPTYHEANRIYAKAGHHIIFEDDDHATLSEQWVQSGNVPYPPATSAKDNHNFDKWIPEVEAAYGDQTYTAQYCKLVRYHTYDGSQVLYTEQVSPGSAAVWATQPEREQTASEKFTFAGWSTSPNGQAEASVRDSITADIDLYAAYTSDAREFQVRFISEGETLQTTQVKYGQYATFTGTLTQDKAGRHDFDKWNKEPSATPITEPTDFEAVFKHRIDYYDSQSHVYSSEQVSDGANAVSIPSPSKSETAEFTYEFGYFADQYYAPIEDQFAGSQTTSLTNVRSDVDVYAVFKAVRRSYEITFKYNGTEAKVSVPYGQKPVTTAYEIQNSEGRNFFKWDNDVVAVTQAATYNALYCYFIRVHDTASHLYTTLQAGPGQTVTGLPQLTTYSDADTDRYDYAFEGWAKSWVTPAEAPNYTDAGTSPVTGDTDLYAVWKITAVRYRVRYYNDAELVNTEWVARGTAAAYATQPEFKGSYDPSKVAYHFSYWATTNAVADSNPGRAVGLDAVTADLDVYAYYTTETLTAEITVIYDGKQVVLTVNIGDVPSLSAYEGADSNGHEFDGWDKTPTAVTGPATYTAKYKKIVKFYKNATALVDTIQVSSGSAVPSPGTTPTYDSTAQYSFSFNSWATQWIDPIAATSNTSPAPATITADTNLYAFYTKSVRSYQVTINYDGTQAVISVPYGSRPDLTPYEHDDSTGHNFDYWKENVTEVTGPQTYTAEYKAIVIFMNGNSEITRVQVRKGTDAEFPSNVVMPDGPDTESSGGGV